MKNREKQNFLHSNLLCLKATNTLYIQGLSKYLGHGNQRLLRMGKDVQRLIFQLQINLVVKTPCKHWTKICIHNFSMGYLSEQSRDLQLPTADS